MDCAGDLCDLLADRGPHRVREVYELTGDAGISQRTLKRAKYALDVDSFQRGREWWWGLSRAGNADAPEEQL